MLAAISDRLEELGCSRMAEFVRRQDVSERLVVSFEIGKDAITIHCYTSGVGFSKEEHKRFGAKGVKP